MRTIAYSTSKEGKRVRVVNSAGFDYASDDAAELLTAIVDSKQPDTIAVVWDSKTFWQPIFGLLPAAEVAKLADGKAGKIPGQLHWLRLWWGITRHGRVIGIRYVKREAVKGNIYNEKRAELEISELKQYYDPRDTPGLVAVAKLGDEVLSTLANMGLRPTTLVSAIGVYSECVLDKLPIPTIFDMPEETWDAHELAYNTVNEWVANYKPQDETTPVFTYDMSSAYGSALAELPNLKYAEIKQSADIPPPGFVFGVMRGIIHNKTLVSPLVNPETSRPYVGYWQGAMTVDLYSCLRQWDIADMEIKDGYYIYLKRLAKPFDYSMRRLFSFRNTDNALQNNLAKAMSVATWGKMLEMHGEDYGQMFNAIYGSMVVNAVKVKLTDFIYSNKLQDELISVAVDGIKTTRDSDISTERRFGEWRKT